MKIRTSSHPFTLNGLKVPSGVVYVNDTDGKFVFNTIHNFPKFRLIEGFIFYPEKWSRFKVTTSGVAQYLFRGAWIKLAYNFGADNVRKIINKMTAIKEAVRKPAVSARIDSDRKTREIMRDGDAPRVRKVQSEYTPFDGTAYSLRKINNSGDDNPLFNQRVVNESVSLIAPPNHPSKDTCIPKKTDADKNAEKRKKPFPVSSELDDVSVWIRENVSGYLKDHCRRNIHNWVWNYTNKDGLMKLSLIGLSDAEIIFEDCIDNLLDDFAD